MRVEGLLCAIAVVTMAALPQAQSAPPAPKPSKPVVLGSYEYTRKGMIEAAELMPEAGYGLRSSDEAKSFGEIVGHAVLTNFGVCAGARGEENPKKGIDFEATVTAKAELVTLLKASFAFCDAAMAKADPAPTGDLLFTIVHNQRMLGALEGYLLSKHLSLTSPEISRPKKK